jgi:glycosyltransferase involved in cell wall biosynthesis
MEQRPVIGFVVGSSRDWGGASRVIFTLLRLMTFERMEPLILLPRRGPIQQELEERGLRYVVWGPFTALGSVPKYCSAYWRTLRFLRRERVRVLHVNSHIFWRPAELLAAYTLRIPIIAHYHLINDTPAPFMKLCRAAVSVSRYTADHSLPATLAKPVVYNSIDLGRFDAGVSLRDELGLAPADIVVSFIGQIRDVKGAQDFIAIARRIGDPQASAATRRNIRALMRSRIWNQGSEGTTASAISATSASRRISTRRPTSSSYLRADPNHLG